MRHFEFPPSEWTAFARFPTWMWRNEEVRGFIDWLRAHNGTVAPERRVAFHGLDLYSLYNSMRSVLAYLDDVDPQTAAIARERYGCLTPWQADPATYGRAALTGRYRSCENDVVHMLDSILAKSSEYALHDGERFLDAVQNARLVANAERYYRIMYYGSRASWNLRDSPHVRHLEDASALLRAELEGDRVGAQLSRRQRAGDRDVHAGRAQHRPALPRRVRHGRLSRRLRHRPRHRGGGLRLGRPGRVQERAPGARAQLRAAVPCGLAGTRAKDSSCCRSVRRSRAALREAITKPRLERAIGVIYRPETELASHYFQAVLPQQFDEYIWFDETRAVTPFDTVQLEGLPDTYPFGV